MPHRKIALMKLAEVEVAVSDEPPAIRPSAAFESRTFREETRGRLRPRGGGSNKRVPLPVAVSGRKEPDRIEKTPRRHYLLPLLVGSAD